MSVNPTVLLEFLGYFEGVLLYAIYRYPVTGSITLAQRTLFECCVFFLLLRWQKQGGL